MSVTDEYMHEQLRRSRVYTVVLLVRGPADSRPDRDALAWEHGRRNFVLRDQGIMPIVLPVRDGSDLCGIAVFDATPDDTARLMDADPGVQAGIFTYELHPCRGFPGASLPG